MGRVRAFVIFFAASALAVALVGGQPIARAQEPTLEKVIGQLSDGFTGPLQGAYVQACTGAAGTCFITQTDQFGAYELNGLNAGLYTFRWWPPSNSTNVPVEARVFLEGFGVRDMGNLQLPRTGPFPAGASIAPSRFAGESRVPILYWGDRLTFTLTPGCVGGSGFFAVDTDPDEVFLARNGSFVEVSPGTYSATIEPLRPAITAFPRPVWGYAFIDYGISCPGSGGAQGFVDVFVDPSSAIRTTSGSPIAGATVELSRAEGQAGPFVAVPTGSALISPATRSNPQITDQTGRFGWDLVAGFYRIRAAAPGCVDPADPTRAFIETAVFAVPPQIIDLDLRLSCDTLPPTTVASVTPGANANGWNNAAVTVTLTATDNPGGSGVREIVLSAAGAEPIVATTVSGATVATVISTEGETTLSYFARDNAGNVEASRNATVRIDRTAPTTTAVANPAPNARGWNRTPVVVTLTATDTLSGVAQTEFSLDGASFAPYGGGISINTDGVHTLRYRSVDRAGNTETTTVLVVRIDRTPPEATIRFDPLTVDFAVVARDDVSGPSGAATSAPGSDAIALTTGRSSAASDSDDDRSVRIYHLEDRAGNTIELVVRLKREDDELEASLVSLRMNGGAPVTLPANELKFEWAVSRGVLKELEQKISVGKGHQKQKAQAHFEAKKNETRIEQEDGKIERELTRAGLVLLRLETDRGALVIRFD